MHWKQTLNIPSEAKLSPSASDLIKRLMTDSEVRLGRNGIQEIQ